MGFSVSTSYTSITIRYSGAGSGWTFDYEISTGESSFGTSSTSYTFSGLAEGTSYRIAGVAYDENGVTQDYVAGTYTTDEHPAPEATFSASSSGSTITASWSNFQSVSYTREIWYELHTSPWSMGKEPIAQRSKTIVPGTQNDSVSFSDLQNGTYDVYTYVYNTTDYSVVRTDIARNIVVSGGYTPAVFNAVSTGYHSIRATLSNISSRTYDRTYTITIQQASESWSQTVTRTVSAGSTSNIVIDFTGLIADTVYNITCVDSAHAESYSDSAATDAMPIGVWVYDGSTWRPAQPYVYNGSTWKKATAKIYDGSTWKPS